MRAAFGGGEGGGRGAEEHRGDQREGQMQYCRSSADGSRSRLASRMCRASFAIGREVTANQGRRRRLVSVQRAIVGAEQPVAIGRDEIVGARSVGGRGRNLGTSTGDVCAGD